MVSLSDTAAQIQISTMKQDAAEAAFKARHSFNSSDAFKQIFDDVDRPATAAPTPREEAPPVKQVHERSATRKSEHKDDSIAKSAEDDKETSEAEIKKMGAPKHDKSKVAKKDKTDRSDDCSEHDDCDKADATTDTTTATKVADQSKPDDCAKGDADVLDAKAQGDVKADKETTTVVSQDVASTQDGDTQTPATAQQTKPDAATIALANMQLIAKDNLPTLKGTPEQNLLSQVSDFRKSSPLHDKAALQKADKNGSTGADDAFAAALDGDVNLAKDAQTKDTQADAKTERAATKEATQKHDDQLDLLQGKFSANATPPAAGDRAISLALKATDTSAPPTLNGSAGSGSPLAPKGDSEAAALTGLEGLRAGRAAEPASFAATLRGTKDAQASLMIPSEQVAVSMHRMAKSGTSQYELQLHPAELGRVDIKLEINKDGLVHATVSADNQQAFDMLQKDSKALERALQQAGLQTDDSSLSFSLRDGSNQAQQQQAQQNSGNAWNKWMDKTLPEEPIQSKVLAFDVAGTNGRIDLRV